jgi:alpha-amylase/alpha-mannosidase (GH57 family)
MSSLRYVCIHGHFYQPPRENPWLDIVEVQDSAAPYHDWNERITRECYAPNTRSRLVDGQGQILGLRNNYAWISFNFGPTLLSWMAARAPEVLEGIVEADKLSRERRGGHGNAMAQAYNHIILPLASARDIHTQVRWGIADFKHRFGRDPEGMWLPETAVDVASLEALAEQGIRFTVLAPYQALRWRRLGQKNWVETTGAIDPSRPYVAKLPSGRSIAIFFYDGAISRQVAFERLLDNGDAFLGRLHQAFDPARTHPQLVHIATDGESYGHHHAHGDMALAYALEKLENEAGVRLTNYGEFLERHPPDWEVEIRERTAWSCAHGIERWASDCGCRMRGDWHQRWRAPLRKALDHLKEQLDHLFSTRGRECFPDPWAAREAYIEIIFDRSQKSVRHFMKCHGHPDLDDSQVRDALRLLEMQRHGMLMFTSCGWFFDDISGIETLQCLHYAAHAIHLAKGFQRDFEKKFVQALKAAPSNLAQFATGRGVWETLIQPAVVDLDRVLAHYAVSLIYSPRVSRTTVLSFDVEVLDEQVRNRAATHLAVGRLRVRSRQTWEDAESAFVVIHYGGLDFHTVLKPMPNAKEYDSFMKRLLDTYRDRSMADVTALVAREFDGKTYRLEDLFVDEQRRIIGIVLQDRVEDYQRTFDRLAMQDDDVINRLGRMTYPIPSPLRLAASCSLDGQLREALVRLGEDNGLSGVRAIIDRGRTWGYRPIREPLERILSDALRDTLAGLSHESNVPMLARRAAQILDAAAVLEISPDVWLIQNQLLDAYVRLSTAGPIEGPLRELFVDLATRLKIGPGLLGWRP